MITLPNILQLKREGKSPAETGLEKKLLTINEYILWIHSGTSLWINWRQRMFVVPRRLPYLDEGSKLTFSERLPHHNLKHTAVPCLI